MMPAPTTLTLRLLAAARHAYAIQDDGVVPDEGWTPTPYAYVGYTDQPMGFRAGLDNQDGGFTATLPEGVLVSIRGTTPPGDFVTEPTQVIWDWAGDAVASLAGAGGSPPGFPGKVHLGFYKSFMRLWPKLQPVVAQKIRTYAQAHGAERIFVTGHSKGGAITALAAWRLKTDYPEAEIVVRSFAGARIGDDNFVSSYNAKVQDHIRYEYDADIVPHLPLSPDIIRQLGAPMLISALLSASDVGYASAGRLCYIRADGTLAADCAALEQERVDALLARARANDFGYIVDCHGVDPLEAGYYRAAYPT